MATLTIQAEKRENVGKGESRRLRAAGWVPGVLYGLKQATTAVKVNARLLEQSFDHPEKMHQPLEFTFMEAGKQKTLAVVLKDYEADIITRRFTHVDFMQIDLEKKIETSVPVHFIGRAEGVKEGGILKSLLRAVDILSLPQNIPSFIEYDVSALKIGQVIHCRDLALPAGCELVAKKADLPLITVLAKEAEEVAAVVPEATAAAAAAAAGATPAAPGTPAAKEAPKEAAPAKDAAKGSTKTAGK